MMKLYVVHVCNHRRGSNVSLTLDMCTPGCTEPYGYGAQLSPRDQSAQEYLRQGTHVLTPTMLHTRAMDDQSLQSEFYVSASMAARPPACFRSIAREGDGKADISRTDENMSARHREHPAKITHIQLGSTSGQRVM